MKKSITMMCLAGLLFVACSHDGGFPSEDEYGLSQAEEQLGLKISDRQTWQMTAQVNVSIANIPSNFKSTAIAIFDDDPFIDTLGTVSMLAYEEGNVRSLEFEMPIHLTKLYAACIDNDGQMLVRPFKVSDGKADMS